MKAAYIGRIYIENFHAFQGKNEIPIIKEDGTLQQWTVIVGENNSGKTSLLKAVAGFEGTSSSSSVDNNNNKLLHPRGVVDNNKLLHPRGVVDSIISSDAIDNQDVIIGCDVFFRKYIDNQNFRTSTFLKYKRRKEISEKPEWFYSLDWENLEYTPGVTVHYNNVEGYDVIENLKVYGYGVSRKMSKAEPYDEHNAITLIYTDKRLADLTDWLFQLDFASKNSKNKAVRAKAIGRINHIEKLIISKIFPDISGLRFTTTTFLTNLLEFQTKDGWFQLHELGYGYQTTLAWIFDLSKRMMERYPESKQPLREPAVVLIDEIDLHLHPAWQRRIINYLSDNFTATQFIVTTHSPHVLQELQEVNLVQLKRENGATKIICRPNSSFQGWTIEEILNDVLETPSTHSVRYEELMQKFDKALDNEDFKTAHETFETLSKILHPNSPDRKILKLQLSQLVEQ